MSFLLTATIAWHVNFLIKGATEGSTFLARCGLSLGLKAYVRHSLGGQDIYFLHYKVFAY